MKFEASKNIKPCLPSSSSSGDVATRKIYIGNDAIVSGITPVAQIARLGDPDFRDRPDHADDTLNTIAKFNESEDVRAIISIMYLFGLRVSEALQIHSRDVDQRLNVLVKGLKGSNDRFINVSYDTRFWLLFRQKNRYLGLDTNRYYIYRLFKKKGIYAKFEGNKKSSVTHSYRHSFCDSNYQLSGDLSTVANAVGHKSTKSTEYYVNRRKIGGKNPTGDIKSAIR